MKAKATMWPVVVVCLGIMMAAGIVGRAADDDDDVAEHFSLMDRNDNGQLSTGEFSQAQEMAQEVLSVDFASADTDEDGTLNVEEYQTYLSSIETVSSAGGDSSDGQEEDALEALASILTSSASTESETAEIEQLIEDLEEAGETDVITYVLSRPTAYPYAYRTLGVWAKRYPGRLTWANKIRAHNAVHPKRPKKPAGPDKKLPAKPKPKPRTSPGPVRPSGPSRPSAPARPSGRPSPAPRPGRR